MNIKFILEIKQLILNIYNIRKYIKREITKLLRLTVSQEQCLITC